MVVIIQGSVINTENIWSIDPIYEDRIDFHTCYLFNIRGLNGQTNRIIASPIRNSSYNGDKYEYFSVTTEEEKEKYFREAKENLEKARNELIEYWKNTEQTTPVIEVGNKRNKDST